MNVSQSGEFQKWFVSLRDGQAKQHILVRLRRLARGNFGDVKPVGEGISELRIHYGPGYRIYLSKKGDSFVLLLCGGDKDNQTRDIARAKQLAKGSLKWTTWLE